MNAENTENETKKIFCMKCWCETQHEIVKGIYSTFAYCDVCNSEKVLHVEEVEGN